MLECVVNVSEGRNLEVIDALGAAAGPDLLDVHSDPHHHRTVLTLVGDEAPRRVTSAAVAQLDLASHRGAHPRLGVVDVVPFVPLAGSTMSDAVAARDRFAAWLAEAHGVPCFVYGPERALPEIRRSAFDGLTPSTGPSQPHPTAGACCVGARPVLVAYNVWLRAVTLARAQEVARLLRQPAVRALALQVGGEVQVSMNLVDPDAVGPAAAFDLVAEHVGRAAIERAELVGLLPNRVLDAIDPARWSALDMAPERTIEARLARRSG